MAQTNDSDLVKTYLQRWLGHGNPAGQIWLIGAEEKFGTKELLTIAREWASEGSHRIWSPKDRTGFRAPSQTYTGLVKMLLWQQGWPSKTEVDEFKKTTLGSIGSNHAILEVSAIPRRSSKEDRATHLGPFSLDNTDFTEERIRSWCELFHHHRPRVIILYGQESRKVLAKALSDQIGCCPIFDSKKTTYCDSVNVGCRVIVCRHPANGCARPVLEGVRTLIKEVLDGNR